MKRLIVILISLTVFFISCSKKENPPQNPPPADKIDSTKLKDTVVSEQNIKYNVNEPPLPYEIKEDGLYVYADGPDIKNYYSNRRCFEYVQKNYKYIRVPSSLNEIKNDEKKIWGKCRVEKTCTTDLGKPSLYELGYERHKEREIKPEDNRPGVDVRKEKKYHELEDKVIEEFSIKYIDKDKFIKMTRDEFIHNGIVVIGKQISRVVIKKPIQLPFAYPADRVPVEFEKHYYGCDDENKVTKYVPEVIADFKRINFKENIFEFIQENPMPKNADYLSDMEYIRLTENIHQLIPRTNDKTLNPKKIESYSAGYYLIEYYNGDQLYDYHCIQIDGKGKRPNYWNPIEPESPQKVEFKSATEKYALVLAEFKNQAEAENFIKTKDNYPLIILPNSANQSFLVGRIFFSKVSAQNEMNRVLNMGIPRQDIRIISLK